MLLVLVELLRFSSSQPPFLGSRLANHLSLPLSGMFLLPFDFFGLYFIGKEAAIYLSFYWCVGLSIGPGSIANKQHN